MVNFKVFYFNGHFGEAQLLAVQSRGGIVFDTVARIGLPFTNLRSLKAWARLHTASRG